MQRLRLSLHKDAIIPVTLTQVEALSSDPEPKVRSALESGQASHQDLKHLTKGNCVPFNAELISHEKSMDILNTSKSRKWGNIMFDERRTLIKSFLRIMKY